MSVLTTSKSTAFHHTTKTFRKLSDEKQSLSSKTSIAIPKYFNITFAIQHGYFRCVRYLLELGYDPNERDNNLRTTLILCTYVENAKWRLSLAQNLLEKGARIALEDHARRNSLHHACALQRDELVELYLTCIDFNIEAKDCEGCTCLHYAAITGNSYIAEMLIEAAEKKGIQLDQCINKEGCSAAVLALKYGHIDCANTITHRDADEFFVVPCSPSIFELSQQNDKKESKKMSTSKFRQKSTQPATLSFGLLKIIFNDSDTNYSTRLHDMVEENRLAKNDRHSKKLTKTRLHHVTNGINLNDKGYAAEFIRLKSASHKSINEYASTEALVNQEQKIKLYDEDQQQKTNGERLSPRLQLMLQQHPNLQKNSKTNEKESETISNAINTIIHDDNNLFDILKTNNRPSTAKIDVLMKKLELQKQSSLSKQTLSDNYSSDPDHSGTITKSLNSTQTTDRGKISEKQNDNFQASVSTYKPYSTTETTDIGEFHPSSISFGTTSMKSEFSAQVVLKPSSTVRIKKLDQPSRLSSGKPPLVPTQEEHSKRTFSSLKQHIPNRDKLVTPKNILSPTPQKNQTTKHIERVRSAPLVTHKQMPFSNKALSDESYSQMIYAGRPISAILHTNTTRASTPPDSCTIREANSSTLYNNPEELFGLNAKDLFGTHVEPIIVSKTTPKDSNSEKNRTKRNLFHKQHHLWQQDVDQIIDLYNIHRSSTYRTTVPFESKPPVVDNEQKTDSIVSTRRNSIVGGTAKKLLQRNLPRSKTSTLAQLNLTRRNSVIHRPATVKVANA
ncbi:unnamed protein product [Didymodactylos carnosus]|uniref:Uncharacterized protein n=2 Tax=Didymodactylos carnosus TaxID=1234261 RepID=A0A813QRT7_9BILA|nr:unnamed protein product [Didymodactylos carnosus]CAF3553637.1 unnamed protein product [Didymodactylos carnosus]